MNDETAVGMFASLAHPARLSVFRLLMREGAEGLAAGEISHQLGIPPPSLSFHLASLKHAGLVRSKRHKQSVIYTTVVEHVAQLMEFIASECCHGEPEICALSRRMNQDRKASA